MALLLVSLISGALAGCVLWLVLEDRLVKKYQWSVPRQLLAYILACAVLIYLTLFALGVNRWI